MRCRLVPAAVAVLALMACGDDGGSVEAFCATARRFADDNPATVFDRYDPADPAGAAELLRGAGAQLRAWADEAPGEVDDDVDTIADAADELAAAFEAPSPSPDRRAELAERFTEVEEASGRVTSYARGRCAVELDPAVVTTSTPTSSPSSTAVP